MEVEEVPSNERASSFSKFLTLIQSSNSITAGITYFLNRVTKEGELDLVWEYITRHPACEHLLTPLGWDKERRTYDVLLVVFKTMVAILHYTSSSPSDASRAKLLKRAGEKMVLSVLTNHMNSIYHCLRTVVPHKLVGACLRLLAAMVMQGVESAKQMQSVFNFSYKPLTIFINKNAPISGEVESLRDLMMTFSLSFLELDDAEVTTALLEFKGFLSSFFSLLPKDDPKNICRFLASINDKVVMCPAVSKKAKSLFFTQFVLKQIALLLNYPRGCVLSSGDLTEPELCSYVQEMSYKLLERLGSDAKLGILYRPKTLPEGLEKTNNPVLLHLLLFLSNCLQDASNQRLLLAITTESVDLLLPFVKSLSFSLEPQPSSKWLREIAFLSQIYSHYPSLDTVLDGGSAGQPEAKWVGIAVSATAPPTVVRAYYNQGLQHPLPLVKHATLKLVNVVLQQTVPVLSRWGPIRKNSRTISSFLVRYADMVLKCLPDVKTLVSLWHALQGKKKAVCGSNMEDLLPEDKLKNADLEDGKVLLAQLCAALAGYQRLCPDIFLQINLNPAKLLPPLPKSGCCKDGLPCSEVLQGTLELMENSSDSRTKNREVVSSLLWLLLCETDQASNIYWQLIKKILFKDYLTTNSSLDCFLSAFVASCSSCPDRVSELVESLATVISELLVNRHCKEREAMEVLRCCEETGGGGGLTLQQVVDLPGGQLFDILDVIEEPEGGGGGGGGGECCQMEVEMAEEADVLVGVGMFVCNLVATVATTCDKENNPMLCSFLSSLLLRCSQEFCSLDSLHKLVYLVLHHAPSLSLFIIHHLLVTGVHRSEGEATKDGSGSETSPNEVDLKEVAREAMRQSCRMIEKPKPAELKALNLMRHLEPSDWNEFVYTCLKCSLGDSSTLQYLSLVLPLLYDTDMADMEDGKGLRSLEMLYEMIWSHSKFLDFMASPEKESLVELLVTIVELDPSVALGKQSHHMVFLGAYSATMSLSDRGLLYLMFLYEQNCMSAGKFSPFHWGAAALEQHQLCQQRGDELWCSPDTSSQVLRQLDTPTLLKSASYFCPTQPLQPTNPFSENEECFGIKTNTGNLYDPAFLLPLLSHSLEPGVTVDCRHFVSTGCLGFLVVCLSSLDYYVREASSHTLSRFKVHLETSKFREKAQISLLLEVLQNTIQELNAFLPSVFTSLVAKASRLFLQADNPVYSIVAHFMVYKPTLNLRDIPLLTTMLHSSSSNATQERAWLMKVLVDGLKCAKDLVLYDRHKVLSHVTVLAESGLLDRKTKSLAVELLKKADELYSRKRSRLKL